MAMRITLFEKSKDAEGHRWCWQTEYGHGQADTPDGAVIEAYKQRAAQLTDEARATKARADQLAREAVDMMDSIADL